LTGTVEAADAIRLLRASAASIGRVTAPRIMQAMFMAGFDGRIEAEGSVDEFPELAYQPNLQRLYVYHGDLRGQVIADSAGMIMVVNGDFDADATIDADLRQFMVVGADADVLAGSSLTVDGALQYAFVNGDLAGDWTVTGDLQTFVQLGDVVAWTLQTPAAEATSIGMLRLGAVRQMTVTGRADIRMILATDVQDGEIEANGIDRLMSLGDFHADLDLAGDDRPWVLRSAFVRRDVTDADWRLAGETGSVDILGKAEGFDLVSEGGIQRVRMTRADDSNVQAGLAADALDDGVVTAGEVTDGTATIGFAQIGLTRAAGGAAAVSNTILAAPRVGTVYVRESDDFGRPNGSAVWRQDVDGLRLLLSGNREHREMNWLYRPNADAPWPDGDEPIRRIV